MKYQRKPVTVETVKAVQWKGDNIEEVRDSLLTWGFVREAEDLYLSPHNGELCYNTDIGWWADIHDWLVNRDGMYEIFSSEEFQDQFTPFLEDNN